MDISKRLSNVVFFFIVKCNESEHKSNSFIIYLAKKIYWPTKEMLQTFFANGSNRNVEIEYLLYSSKFVGCVEA